jgi:2-polyprenyl-6-methoxyphenol hydroxylase-like FAD-dependent oxidoreductase
LRGTLQGILAEATKALGVEIRFGCRIEKIDSELPSVIVNGEEIYADFIVGADGEQAISLLI